MREGRKLTALDHFLERLAVLLHVGRRRGMAKHRRNNGRDHVERDVCARTTTNTTSQWRIVSDNNVRVGVCVCGDGGGADRHCGRAART